MSYGCCITRYKCMVYNMVYMIPNWNGIYRKLYAIYHVYIPWYITFYGISHLSISQLSSELCDITLYTPYLSVISQLHITCVISHMWCYAFYMWYTKWYHINGIYQYGISQLCMAYHSFVWYITHQHLSDEEAKLESQIIPELEQRIWQSVPEERGHNQFAWDLI